MILIQLEQIFESNLGGLGNVTRSCHSKDHFSANNDILDENLVHNLMAFRGHTNFFPRGYCNRFEHTLHPKYINCNENACLHIFPSVYVTTQSRYLKMRYCLSHGALKFILTRKWNNKLRGCSSSSSCEELDFTC